MVKTENTEKYTQSIGRRKTASARVRIVPSKNITIKVNGKDFKDYFKTATLQDCVMKPFREAGQDLTFSVTAKVQGGGISGQAQAVRHGIARAIIAVDKDTRIPLKKQGLLSRDSRKKERKKFGLKKARKSSQWSKR